MRSASTHTARNIRLYPWFKFCQNLLFWQAIWFLYFQTALSPAEAVLLYAIYDIATTTLEVPSGYLSDRIGRRLTLIGAALCGAAGAGLIAIGEGFGIFALGQICLGGAAALASGTDSALLYESLKSEGRDAEIEQHETRAWQFTLFGLASSAVTGGVMAVFGFPLAFAMGALAQVGCLAIAVRFVEPPHETTPQTDHPLRAQLSLFKQAMRQPALVWLFGISVLMYGFGHLPLVFGQPFIAQALERAGWMAEAPLVSGVVTAAMMGVSALAVLIAVQARRMFGLGSLLLLAFGIQVSLAVTLAATPALLAIAVLLLRKVPDSLSRPFIIARIQPLLSDVGRATYLSIQSFVGRLLFAGSLLMASMAVAQRDQMTHADIRLTLGWYAAVGLMCLFALALTVRRAGVDEDA